MHRITIQTVLLAAVLAPSACQNPGAPSGGQSASLPELPAGTSQLTSVQMRQAQELYLTKCARCHKFYDPRVYSDADWRLWMRKMSRKAKLDADEEQLLTQYLNAFRGTDPTPPPK